MMSLVATTNGINITRYAKLIDMANSQILNKFELYKTSVWILSFFFLSFVVGLVSSPYNSVI